MCKLWKERALKIREDLREKRKDYEIAINTIAKLREEINFFKEIEHKTKMENIDLINKLEKMEKKA